MIIDVHTHVFPDAIAARAIARLEVGNCRAQHDGTVSGLLRSMDRAGIDKAVVCSIATKPEQFEPILRWSRTIASDRLIPLASIHPADPGAVAHVGDVKAAGLAGIKLHPYYQDFDLASEQAFPLYEALAAAGLAVVAHTGYDMAFPRDGRADPAKVAAVTARFPTLKFMATHFGGWQNWREVGVHLIGRPISMEISLSLDTLPAEEARAMVLAHPLDRLYFGSDSPWEDQASALDRLRGLGLPQERLQAILWDNAARFFGIGVSAPEPCAALGTVPSG